MLTFNALRLAVLSSNPFSLEHKEGNPDGCILIVSNSCLKCRYTSILLLYSWLEKLSACLKLSSSDMIQMVGTSSKFVIIRGYLKFLTSRDSLVAEVKYGITPCHLLASQWDHPSLPAGTLLEIIPNESMFALTCVEMKCVVVLMTKRLGITIKTTLLIRCEPKVMTCKNYKLRLACFFPLNFLVLRCSSVKTLVFCNIYCRSKSQSRFEEFFAWVIWEIHVDR